MPVKMQLLPVVSPHDFGAVGDGIVDDTAAVLRAMRCAETVIGAGNYRITETLFWPRGLRVLKDISFCGDVPHGPVVYLGPGTKNVLLSGICINVNTPNALFEMRS